MTYSLLKCFPDNNEKVTETISTDRQNFVMKLSFVQLCQAVLVLNVDRTVRDMA